MSLTLLFRSAKNPFGFASEPLFSSCSSILQGTRVYPDPLVHRSSADVVHIQQYLGYARCTIYRSFNAMHFISPCGEIVTLCDRDLEEKRRDADMCTAPSCNQNTSRPSRNVPTTVVMEVDANTDTSPSPNSNSRPSTLC